MSYSCDAATQAELDACTNLLDRAAVLVSALGASGRRFVCKRDADSGAADVWATGATFLNAAMVGSMLIDSATGDVSLGTLNNVTTKTSADLATGKSVARIVNGTRWYQDSIGLNGSSSWLEMPSNPSATGGIGIKPSANIPAITGLPLAPSYTPPTGVFSTMTIENTSGSATATNFITPMFGHPFKKGDVPAGSYVKLETSNGTDVPYTMFNTTTWSDGSLKFASFLARIPVSIAGSGTEELRVKNTGAAPAASARALSDITGGSDINVELTGLDNLSGTWISSLNQGIADNDDLHVLGDGPVGKILRIRQQFMQSGTNHGQLECYWYVAILQNSSGGLHGVRYLGRVTQPWMDIDSPAKNYRSFTDANLKNSSTLVRDMWSQHQNTTSFTYDGVDAMLVSAAGHGLNPQTLVRVTGTTLPTGLAAATSYFTKPTGNSLEFNNDCRITASGRVFLSGTASGDCQVKSYPYITHFGSMWTCGASAKWDYVQAGGSAAADAQVRIKHDAVYWQTTGVIPTYGSFTPAAQTGYSYDPSGMGPIERIVGGTGDRADIGLLPSWFVLHLKSQRAVDEQVVRVVGLSGAHAAIALYNSTTKTIWPVVNKNYSGMPNGSGTLRWSGTADYTSGFTGVATSTITGLSDLVFHHMPCMFAYPYIMTGEPQYFDLMSEMGHLAIMNGYTTAIDATPQKAVGERKVRINGTEYTSVMFSGSNRTAAWGSRDIAYVAALAPVAYPPCPSLRQYYTELNNENIGAFKLYKDSLAPQEMRDFGLMDVGIIASPWMTAYLMQSLSQISKMTESTDALDVANHGLKWFNNVYLTHGIWHTTPYRAIVRDASANYITSMTQSFYLGPTLRWDSATNRFEGVVQDDGYSLANGDRLMWDKYNWYEDGEAQGPAAVQLLTRYYVVNVSGNYFQVSLTAGGSPITLTDTMTSWLKAYVQLASPPTTGVIGSSGSSLGSSGYAANLLGALRLSKAAGATVSQDIIDALDARNPGVDYSSTPKHFYAQTY